jgi:hypothetical protein
MVLKEMGRVASLADPTCDEAKIVDEMSGEIRERDHRAGEKDRPVTEKVRAGEKADRRGAIDHEPVVPSDWRMDRGDCRGDVQRKE